MHLSGPQGYDRPVLLPKEQAALRVDIQGQPAALRPVPHEADLPPQEQGTVPVLPDQFGVAEALLTVHQTFRNPRRQTVPAHASRKEGARDTGQVRGEVPGRDVEADADDDALYRPALHVADRLGQDAADLALLAVGSLQAVAPIQIDVVHPLDTGAAAAKKL